MTKYKIYELLKENQNRWYSTMELCKFIKCSYKSAGNALKNLYSHPGFYPHIERKNIQILRFKGKFVFRYNKEKKKNEKESNINKSKNKRF